MPRARNIKPAFFRDAKVVSVSFEARILFIGLWSISDYKGRFKYNPIELKMEIFPADNVDIEKCMSELSSSGLIQIYTEHSGATLVQVVNFEKHQNPHINEKQNKDKTPANCLPSISECEDQPEIKPVINQTVTETPVVAPECSDSDPADSLFLIPDSLSLIPDSKDKDLVPSKDDTSEYSSEFENAWSQFPKRAGGNSKKAAYKKWNERLKQRFTAEDMTSGVIRYKKSLEKEGTINTKYVMQGATFFGPSEHFMESYDVGTGSSNVGYNWKNPPIQDAEMRHAAMIEAIRG